MKKFYLTLLLAAFSLTGAMAQVSMDDVNAQGDKPSFGGFEMNDSMMQMLGGFTVLRLTGMMGMVGIELTKEELLALNAKLNKIKKPKKKEK